jgi:hypothetical protein
MNSNASEAGDLDLIPSKETQKSKATVKKASTNGSILSYRPDRVKSSIPKANPSTQSVTSKGIQQQHKIQAKHDHALSSNLQSLHHQEL